MHVTTNLSDAVRKRRISILSFTQTTSAAKQVWGLTKRYLYRTGQRKSLHAIQVRKKVRSKSYLHPILGDSFDKRIDSVLPVQV